MYICVYIYIQYIVLYIYSTAPDMQVLRGNPPRLRTCGYCAEIPVGSGHACTARKSFKIPDMQVPDMRVLRGNPLKLRTCRY